MKYLAIIAALMSAPASAETLIVDGWSKWSRGGEVRQYVDKRDAVEAVELRGKCLSACAVFLSHTDACVSRKAKFGFHAPSHNGRKASRAVQADFTRFLGSPALGEWFLGEPSARERKVTYLRGRVLIDDFGFKECEV